MSPSKFQSVLNRTYASRAAAYASRPRSLTTSSSSSSVCSCTAPPTPTTIGSVVVEDREWAVVGVSPDGDGAADEEMEAELRELQREREREREMRELQMLLWGRWGRMEVWGVSSFVTKMSCVMCDVMWWWFPEIIYVYGLCLVPGKLREGFPGRLSCGRVTYLEFCSFFIYCVHPFFFFLFSWEFIKGIYIGDFLGEWLLSKWLGEKTNSNLSFSLSLVFHLISFHFMSFIHSTALCRSPYHFSISNILGRFFFFFFRVQMPLSHPHILTGSAEEGLVFEVDIYIYFCF